MTTDPNDIDLCEKLRPAPSPSPELSRKIRKSCTEKLEAKRSMSAKTRLVSCVCLALAVALGLSVLAQERLASLGRAALLGALGWGLVLLVVLLVGFGARRLGGGAARLRMALVVLVPLAFLVYLTTTSSGTTALSEFLGHAEQTGGAVRCGVATFVMGAVASLAIMGLWWGTDPFTPTLTGSVAGLVGGLSVGLPTALSCPGHNSWHLWLGHGLTLVVLVLLGAVVGRKWLCP